MSPSFVRCRLMYSANFGVAPWSMETLQIHQYFPIRSVRMGEASANQNCQPCRISVPLETFRQQLDIAVHLISTQFLLRFATIQTTGGQVSPRSSKRWAPRFRKISTRNLWCLRYTIAQPAVNPTRAMLRRRILINTASASKADGQLLLETKGVRQCTKTAKPVQISSLYWAPSNAICRGNDRRSWVSKIRVCWNEERQVIAVAGCSASRQEQGSNRVVNLNALFSQMRVVVHFFGELLSKSDGTLLSLIKARSLVVDATFPDVGKFKSGDPLSSFNWQESTAVTRGWRLSRWEGQMTVYVSILVGCSLQCVRVNDD